MRFVLLFLAFVLGGCAATVRPPNLELTGDGEIGYIEADFPSLPGYDREVVFKAVCADDCTFGDRITEKPSFALVKIGDSVPLDDGGEAQIVKESTETLDQGQVFLLYSQKSKADQYVKPVLDERPDFALGEALFVSGGYLLGRLVMHYPAAAIKVFFETTRLEEFKQRLAGH